MSKKLVISSNENQNGNVPQSSNSIEKPKQVFAFAVSELSGPLEVNFEMMHMVAYVRKHAPDTALSAWPCTYTAAEFWIQRASFESKIKQLSKSSELSNSIKESDRSEANQEYFVEPEIDDMNRSLPGFRTLLQCGKSSFDESLFNKANSPGVGPNTSVAGKINCLFDESSLYITRSPTHRNRIPSSQIVSTVSNTLSTNSLKENVEFHSQPVLSNYKPKDSCVITSNSSKVISTNVTAQSDVQTFIYEQATHLNPENQSLATENPAAFEIFHDPFGLEVSKMDGNNVETNSHPSVHTSIDRPTKCVMEHPVLETLTNNGDNVNEDDGSTNNLNDTYMFELIDKNVAPTNPGQMFRKTQVQPLSGFNSPTTLFNGIFEAVSKKRANLIKQ